MKMLIDFDIVTQADWGHLAVSTFSAQSCFFFTVQYLLKGSQGVVWEKIWGPKSLILLDDENLTNFP